MAYPKHPGLHSSKAPVRVGIAQKYLEEQLYTMSPIELLVKLYDIAIEACNRKDRDRASRALVELISALNFDYAEIAGRFFHIYKFCMNRVKAGKFSEAKEMLQELRSAWMEASKMTGGSSTTASALKTALQA